MIVSSYQLSRPISERFLHKLYNEGGTSSVSNLIKTERIALETYQTIQCNFSYIAILSTASIILIDIAPMDMVLRRDIPTSTTSTEKERSHVW